MWSELLGVFFVVAYVGYTTSTLLRASAPPLCQSEAHSDCLHTAMPIGSNYAVHLFISRAPVTKLEVKQSPLIHKSILAPLIDNIHIGTIESVTGLEHLCDTNVIYGNGSTEPIRLPWYRRMIKSDNPECESKIVFDVPANWHDNRTSIYLTAVSTEVGEKGYTRGTFGPAQAPISLHYRPEKKDLAQKRYLLKTAKSVEDDLVEEKSYIAVPPLVRFGPIAAFDDYSRTKLSQLGRSHWQSGFRHDEYYAEAQIDSYVSPRDEYLPLANVSDNLLRKRKLLSPNGNKLPTRIAFVLRPVNWRKNAIEKLMMNGVATMETKFGTNQYESDSLKLLFAGNSPVILLLTFSVSMLHMIFEFLAMLSNWSNFKEHCQDHDKAEAVSARAILLDTVFECLILLWLVDEGEARLVQILLTFKIAYNTYRYYKLLQVQHTPSNDDDDYDCQKLSYTDLLKQIHPLEAFKPKALAAKRKAMNSNDFELWALISQSCSLISLFSIWMGYQLIFVPQKSWTSAFIKLGAHLAYGGGFIAMTPQLYKNYYHRTVAHLPWIALTYNFLNTIIDDLFSFLIRMPKEHRISVFRDDIIFVIYWIQKWHYKKEADKIAAAKKVENSPKAMTLEVEANSDKGKARKLVNA